MDVQEADIRELLEYFSKNTYNAWDTHPTLSVVMQRCLELFGQDYEYSVISNHNGELSTNYPSFMVILEGDKNESDVLNGNEVNGAHDTTVGGNLETSDYGNGVSDPEESDNLTSSSFEGFSARQEIPRIKDLCHKARYARCRARFPVPVILYSKKHICRSATLSGGPEIYGRTGFDYFFSGGGTSDSKGADSESPEEEVVAETVGQGDWQIFDRVRNQDIRLLKSFRVETIIDLMVEKKKVKFGVYVTSSEKVDKKNRYSDFNLISLPYPGCEFFRQYRDNGYSGEKLMFEWNQGYVDAHISVPPDSTSNSLKLDWEQYRKWDLIRLTQNYLKLLLAYLRSDSSGLLIHCISGWDRTPLFVSMLRLSLWADGVIHQSLNAEQMLYLTLAYDWLLFGHNLEDRLNKGEEILAFCFYFLKHIVSSDYSIHAEINVEDSMTESVPSSETAHLNIPDLANGDTENAEFSSGNLGNETKSVVNGVHGHENSTPFTPEAGESNGDAQVNGCRETTVELDTANKLLGTYKPIDTEEVSSKLQNGQEMNKFIATVGVLCNGGPDAFKDSGHSDSHGDNAEAAITNVDESQGKLLNGSVPEKDCDETKPAPSEIIKDAVTINLLENSKSVLRIQNGVNHLDAGPDSDSQSALANGNHVEETRLDCATDPDDKEVDTAACNGKESLKESSENSLETNQTTPVAVNCDISRSKCDEKSLQENGCEDGNYEEASIPHLPKLSVRAERLLRVQTHFNALYFPATGLQSRQISTDATGSSGLSLIIDNIATKVGIRAANRSSS